MFEGYIFDCDGVLFDSLKANIEFYNALLAAFDKPLMRKEQIDYIHMATAEESVAYLFEGDPHLEDAQRLRLATDYHRFIPYMKLEDSAREVLETLKERGKKLAVCTNRSTSMEAILEYFKLKSYFDCVVTALNVQNPKPDPEGLLQVLVSLQLAPEACLYVGDSRLDQEAAWRAGIPFAAFRCPELRADFHISSFSEILSLQPKQEGGIHATYNRN